MCLCVCVMQGVLGTLKSFHSGEAHRVGNKGARWRSLGAKPGNLGFSQEVVRSHKGVSAKT